MAGRVRATTSPTTPAASASS
uniref:Uncharacterized protein n=1 Tax=Anopheles dirus TaxID=7168 RepID=A0A182NW26_9DIPT